MRRLRSVALFLSFLFVFQLATVGCTNLNTDEIGEISQEYALTDSGATPIDQNTMSGLEVIYTDTAYPVMQWSGSLNRSNKYMVLIKELDEKLGPIETMKSSLTPYIYVESDIEGIEFSYPPFAPALVNKQKYVWTVGVYKAISFDTSEWAPNDEDTLFYEMINDLDQNNGDNIAYYPFGTTVFCTELCMDRTPSGGIMCPHIMHSITPTSGDPYFESVTFSNQVGVFQMNYKGEFTTRDHNQLVAEVLLNAEFFRHYFDVCNPPSGIDMLHASMNCEGISGSSKGIIRRVLDYIEDHEYVLEEYSFDNLLKKGSRYEEEIMFIDNIINHIEKVDNIDHIYTILDKYMESRSVKENEILNSVLELGTEMIYSEEIVLNSIWGGFKKLWKKAKNGVKRTGKHIRDWLKRVREKLQKKIAKWFEDILHKLKSYPEYKEVAKKIDELYSKLKNLGRDDLIKILKSDLIGILKGFITGLVKEGDHKKAISSGIIKAILESLKEVWNLLNSNNNSNSKNVCKFIIDKNYWIDKDGWKKRLDSPPMIINSRTFVPLRVISESLGADVSWDEATRSIEILVGCGCEPKRINLAIGARIAKVNGISVPLDEPPIIVNDRTMVPLRFISETLSTPVDWNGETRSINLRPELVPCP